jgi:hypothetical protein
MNDIYEYKARKYKHKYLKLKNEYISEGGVLKIPKIQIVTKKDIKETVKATKEGIKKKTKEVKKKAKKGIKKVQKFFNIKSDLKPMSDKEKSKPIDHTKPASDEQKNFKKNLNLLKTEIEKVISPLYKNNQILGNISFNDIFYKGKEKININGYNIQSIDIIISNEITFKINNNNPKNIITYNNIETTCSKYSEYFKNIPRLYDNYQKIVRFEDFMIQMLDIIIIGKNYPPILIWFKEIFNTEYETNKKNRQEEYNETRKRYGTKVADTNSGYLKTFSKEDNFITKNKLFEALDTDKQFLSKNVKEKFKEDFECLSKKNHPGDDKISRYNMSDIFGYCIMTKPYIKNIDYYLLTMIICQLYESFTKYFKIVEDTTKKLPRLPQLFQKFKDNFNNNSIDEMSFFENLNDIISVIKD